MLGVMHSFRPFLAQESLRTWMLGEPASTVAKTNDDLFMFIFWVCVISFVGVMGLVTYFTVKYRRKPGVAQQRSPSHNTPLEVTWTVAPCVILLVMFVWGFKGFMDLQVSPFKGEEILMTGYQWNWEATYENGASNGGDVVNLADKDVPVIRVPQGMPVNLLLTSRDVIHAFYVPAFRVKTDVFPNRYTSLWFQTDNEPEVQYDEQGTEIGRWTDHVLYCAEYCGDGHSQMLGVIRVMPQADFIAWKAEAANVFRDELKPSEVGALLFRAKGCNACHSVDGSASTGPTWQGIYGTTRSFSNASPVTADENYLRESILDPGAKIREGFPNQMQSYQGLLNDKEMFALISYIKTLSESGQSELTDEKTYGEINAEAEAAESGSES